MYKTGFNDVDPYFPGEGGWIEEDPVEILEKGSDSNMEVNKDVPSKVDTDSESEELDSDKGRPEVLNEPHPMRGRDFPLPPPHYRGIPLTRG